MRKTMEKFEKIERFILFFAQIAILIMMILTTADVISRHLLNHSIIGTYEFTERYLMIATIFLSMSYVMKIDGHIKLDLVIERLPQKVTEIFNSVYLLLGTAFILAIGYQGLLMTYDVWEKNIVGTGLISWPVWLSYIWVPIGTFLFTIRLIFQFINSVMSCFGKRNVFGKEGGNG